MFTGALKLERICVGWHRGQQNADDGMSWMFLDLLKLLHSQPCRSQQDSMWARRTRRHSHMGMMRVMVMVVVAVVVMVGWVLGHLHRMPRTHHGPNFVCH